MSSLVYNRARQRFEISDGIIIDGIKIKGIGEEQPISEFLSDYAAITKKYGLQVGLFYVSEFVHDAFKSHLNAVIDFIYLEVPFGCYIPFIDKNFRG